MLYAIILASTAAAPGVCQKLEAEYEGASKRLAMSFAADSGDVAERRGSSIRAQASETLKLLQAHRCSVPTATPAAQPYVSQALRCQLDRVKGIDDPNAVEPDSCDMTRWVRK
ncbi:hypothetical protein [Sphingomonas sp. LH128]|uniref:hypothetical protein n=1 Tax=Sphingomonas sp. LH128 TaxID=473781 RepID=UPI00055B0D8C|nr:hypothetical protein [Sphingomonas sp. LH128]